MKKHLKAFMFLSFFIITSYDKDKEIRRLLNSNKPWDLIEGAYKAGESGDKKYVPMLLHDDGNPGGNISFTVQRIYGIPGENVRVSTNFTC